MSTEAALARLTAGLNNLAAHARAATELPAITPRYPAKRPPWEPEQWAPARDDVRTVNGRADPLPEVGGGTRSRAVAEFMALRDPADAVRWVEAIRKVLAERDRLAAEADARDNAFAEAAVDGIEIALAILAGIYTEEKP